MGNILPNILPNVGQIVQPNHLLGNVLPNVVGKVMCPPVEQSNYPTFGQDSVHDYPEHGYLFTQLLSECIFRSVSSLSHRTRLKITSMGDDYYIHGDSCGLEA